MNFKFFLDATEIPEPIGWDDFELSMQRDKTYHGMQFEASTGTLRFYGAAADYLIAKKQAEGQRANVIFIAQEQCDSEYVEQISGRLNFGKYKEQCGNTCTVSLPVEEASCKVVFKNNFDKKVDLDSLTSINGTTALPGYNNLGDEITLKGKAVQATIEGFVVETGYTHDSDHVPPGGVTFVRPNYEDARYNSINTGQLIAFNNCESTFGGCAGPLTPQLLFEDNILCFNELMPYTSRLKGTITVTGTGGTVLYIKHKILVWNGASGEVFDNGNIVFEDTIIDLTGSPPPLPYTLAFDNTLTNSIQLNEGEGFYAVLEVGLVAGNVHMNIVFDKESHFIISTRKLCPDTQVGAYLIHEALSRVCESITDGCIRVKSPYYGRIDSQPFAFSEDGCGGLRMLTSGLKIRRAANNSDKFFTSLKDLLQGLRAIDNIGFAIEPDDTFSNKYVLRIDEVSEFYKTDVIHTIDAIALATSEVQEGMHYSKVNIGYKNWQVENVNGLDEYNSTREYITDINTISNTLDLLSNLVAGGYAIEITRQQSFAETGAEDTKFDNEVFIITLVRNAYDFTVEQGGFTSPANFYDPATAYNIRLSPLRNLMRWFKSIVNTYPNLTGTGNYLYFSAGTGNLEAECLIPDDCAMEVVTVIEENGDLRTTNFKNAIDYTPLWKNETVSMVYPLSMANYNKIKANPYGVIDYRCGSSGEFKKGFIDQIKYKPAKGTADFTLIKKWE